MISLSSRPFLFSASNPARPSSLCPTCCICTASGPWSSSQFPTQGLWFLDNSHRQSGAFALLPTAEPILGLATAPQLQSFVSLGQSPPAPWTAQQTAFSVNSNNLLTLATHLGHSNLFQCSLGLVLVNLAHHHQHIAPPLTSSIHPPT